jgi:hypothetical protein
MIIAQDEKFCHDVFCTRVHRFTLLQMSSTHLLVYPCLFFCDVFVSVKNITLESSKDIFGELLFCRALLTNISWGFGSQEMATELYVTVSAGYVAGYSGLLRHVMTKTCH